MFTLLSGDRFRTQKMQVRKKVFDPSSPQGQFDPSFFLNLFFPKKRLKKGYVFPKKKIKDIFHAFRDPRSPQVLPLR